MTSSLIDHYKPPIKATVIASLKTVKKKDDKNYMLAPQAVNIMTY